MTAHANVFLKGLGVGPDMKVFRAVSDAVDYPVVRRFVDFNFEEVTL
jgi:hypothetical protein